MKRIAIIALMLLAFIAQAQQKSSIETRALMAEYSKAKSVNAMSKQLVNQLPLRETPQGTVIGVMAKVTPNFDKQRLEEKGIKVTSQVADIVAMRAPIHALYALDQDDDIIYYSVAHKVAPFCDNTRFDTRTDSVQMGLGVPMPFNGEGVLVGITDWGFDYRHPNINSEAERRIARAWDHYRLSGPAPQGFDYGTELVGYEQLFDAVGDTFGLYGYGSHGTHVAGIIGGRGTKAAGSSSSKYIGQAPRVQYLLGSWLLDEASWMDQVVWMRNVAAEEGKRLVINSSWGMYTFSTLDGTSLLSQAINHWSDSGTVFVTSGGNNGDSRNHLQRTFASNTDTLFSTASYYAQGVGQALIYWGEPGESFGAGFYLTNNRDSVIYRSPIFNTASGDFYDQSTVSYDTASIAWNVMVEQYNPLDNRPHVLLNVGKATGIKLHMVAIAPEGNTVNVWNICNLENHAGNIGCAFSQGGFYGHQNGDGNYAVGEPACAEKAISVAAHAYDRIKSDGTYEAGALTTFSSRGPTLDGRCKPEISAPGSNVISSVNSRDESENNAPHSAVVTANGTRYFWATMSGTSMSGPAVTGVVALMLQANPNLTVEQIRNIIFTTARNDNRTGALHANDSMSVEWGHGKIDALRCVNAAYDLLSIEDAQQIEVKLIAYPNPATDQVTVLTGSNQPCTIEVFATNGQLVATATAESEITFDISQWSKGLYVVRCSGRTGHRFAKIIKH